MRTSRFAILLALSGMFATAPVFASPEDPVEGVDYIAMPGGQPFLPLAGKIELAEVFGYWCIHCAHFAPKLEAFAEKLPKDVRLTYVPAVWRDNDPFARAFFAAQSMGVLGKTHDALFDAVHEGQTVPQNASVDQLVAFFAKQGVDPVKFKAAMLSPKVDAQLKRASTFAVASKVDGTPTLIVNGVYKVQGNSAENQLKVANALIARARRASP